MPVVSAFSQELTRLVTEKSIRKTHLSQLIFVDRATLFRYLRGDTLPPRETVAHIAKVMRLSPLELKQLMQSYEISANGGINVFKQRELVAEIVKNPFSLPVVIPDTLRRAPEGSLENHLANSEQILSALRQLFATTSGPAYEVRAFTQSHCPVFWQALAEIPERQRARLQIEHIVKMSEVPDDFENIRLFRNVLPFLIPPKDDEVDTYRVRYYYDHCRTSSDLMTEWFPNIIFSDRMALLLNFDFTGGIVLQDNPLAFFGATYEQIREHTWPLTTELLGLDGLSELLIQWDAKSHRRKYILMPQPCAFECLNEELLRDLLQELTAAVTQQPETLQFAKRFGQSLTRRIKCREKHRAKHQETYMFYTDSGYQQVVATHQFMELMGLPFALGADAVVKMLQSLEERGARDGTFFHTILQDELFQLTKSGLCLTGLEENKLVLWRMIPGKPTLRHVIVEEKSIVNAFDDYFLNALAEQARM